jgi:hypothetical protein
MLSLLSILLFEIIEHRGTNGVLVSKKRVWRGYGLSEHGCVAFG